MKFNKITNNQIQILFSLEDMKSHNVSAETFLSDNDTFQNIIQTILLEAEKQVDFKTENCKLMLESIIAPDGGFVFTITKFFPYCYNSDMKNSAILKLENLDDFLHLCTYISNINNLDHLDWISHKFSLFYYDSQYYLYIVNTNSDLSNSLLNILVEFGELIPHSAYLDGALHEYSKIVFKNINLVK
jgi:negative regulator of genetic competence, sporulation and motility